MPRKTDGEFWLPGSDKPTADDTEHTPYAEIPADQRPQATVVKRGTQLPTNEGERKYFGERVIFQGSSQGDEQNPQFDERLTEGRETRSVRSTVGYEWLSFFLGLFVCYVLFFFLFFSWYVSIRLVVSPSALWLLFVFWGADFGRLRPGVLCLLYFEYCLRSRDI